MLPVHTCKRHLIPRIGAKAGASGRGSSTSRAGSRARLPRRSASPRVPSGSGSSAPARVAWRPCRRAPRLGPLRACRLTNVLSCQPSWPARVAAVIEREFGVTYHPDHVGRLLKAAGWTVQKPTERATQRDEDEIAAWREQKWPEIKKKPRRRAARSSGSTNQLLSAARRGVDQCSLWSNT